jgi:hypothetical protein
MKLKIPSSQLSAVLVAAIAIFLAVPQAEAVPSFARQTGLPCSACHYTFPELTPFGRQFKLRGYTVASMEKITTPGKGTKAGLELERFLPLSAFFQASVTNTNKPQAGTQNGSFELPQAVSLFLAGAMASHFGGLVQATYNSQKDHFGIDNSDLRYANRTKIAGKELAYGVTMNNNPTVEDLWNSTPAWGFPWVGPDSVPTPIAAPLVAGPLAQDVAGLGAYAMWDNHLYIAGTGYRTEHIGAPQPNPGTGFDINIRGVAPYWRAAWQQTLGDNYLEIGTYGLHVSSFPQAVVGSRNTYTDLAVDFQYERILPKLHNDVLTLHGTYIHEHSDLDATFAAEGSDLLSHVLNTTRADATFHFGNKFAATGGFFLTTGTGDSTLYAAAPITGSASGSPNSKGYIVQFGYWPVQNIELTAQYTGYNRFNGAATNYDGSGRKASDNNAFYATVWVVF